MELELTKKLVSVLTHFESLSLGLLLKIVQVSCLIIASLRCITKK